MWHPFCNVYDLDTEDNPVENGYIDHVCKCGSTNVNIMSVVENKITTKDGITIPTADITYICNDCGYAELDKNYLYKY